MGNKVKETSFHVRKFRFTIYKCNIGNCHQLFGWAKKKQSTAGYEPEIVRNKFFYRGGIEMANTVSTKEFESYSGEPDVERLKAAYRGEKTDRVPNFEILIEDRHVEKILGKPSGNTLSVGGEIAKGAGETSAALRPMFAEDYIALCKVIGQDAIAMEALWTPIKQKKEDGIIDFMYDKSLKTREDLERVVWPGEPELEHVLRYVREYKKAVEGTRIGVMMLSGCLFQTLYEFVVGMHDCMIMSLENQDLLGELISKSADFYEELHRRAIAEGLDILFVADDFAFNTGMFVPPDIFKKIWRPSFGRIIQPALEAKIPIKFHSDGKLDEAMDMLIEMGIDCINPMDPSGCDYREYKKRYGHRVTLSGNIDIEFPLVRGNAEDVEKDVIAHCEVMMEGGRWEAGSSHSIVNYIPHENYITMVNAIHRYGRY